MGMQARFEVFNSTFRFSGQDRRALREALAAKQGGVLVDLQRNLRALRIVRHASTTRRVKPSAYALAATTVRRALNRLPLIDSASRARDGLLRHLDFMARLKLPSFKRDAARERRAAIERLVLETLEEHGIRTGGRQAADVLAIVLRATLGVDLGSDPDNKRRALMRARAARDFAEDWGVHTGPDG